ncbi:MAG TPA: protein translocase subunit SecD [Acidothermaceae bacterium]
MPPATRSSSGRPLTLVLLLLVLLYGGMALAGRYTPTLGLDLRGGTTVTLKPTTTAGNKVKSSDLETAKNILLNRVNSLGVGNAEVVREGSNIVISLPGKNTQGALDNIGKTALLSIRQVYESNDPSMTGALVADTSATVTQSPAPATPAPSTSATPSSAAAPSTASQAPATSPKALGGGAPQAEPAGFVRAASSTAASAAAAPTPAAAAGSTAASPSAAASPVAIPTVAETTPTAAELAAYQALDCTKDQQKVSGQEDIPTKFMVSCTDPQTSPAAYKYLLMPTLIQGKEISSADATLIGTTGAVWGVNLTFKSAASSRWANFTAKNINKDTAVVLDGLVTSAEYIAEAIPGGNTQISGNFTHKTASALANSLKYGALPLAFEPQTAYTVSASLGSSELKAGLLAGALGLVLVVLYSIFYYRGLSVVTVSSLALSAAIQYPIIVLLGKSINYTLTLAGIAGLIVAIGVTADSFVVFFERLRDEVRDGNSLRTSVEKGWVRARRTIVSADFVSIIAAVILYWLAIGDVRGFAFTLGLSTIIDLVVVFLFTKPLISLLAKTKFFGNGHRLSGLDPGHLGVQKIAGTGTVVMRRAPARKV